MRLNFIQCCLIFLHSILFVPYVVVALTFAATEGMSTAADRKSVPTYSYFTPFSLGNPPPCILDDPTDPSSLVSDHVVGQAPLILSTTHPQVKIQGHSVLQEELEALLNNFEMKDLRNRSVQDELEQAINELYMKEGHLTSRVSERIVEDDLLTFHILEGKVLEIVIENESDLRLRQFYICDRIRRGAHSPFNANDLESHLRLLQTDPLIHHIEPRIVSSGTAGASRLKVRVTETERLLAQLSVDNYSPPSIGSVRYGLALGYRNLTRLGDQIAGSYYRSTTGGLNLFNLNFGVPLNAMNGTLSVRWSRSWTKITQDEFEALRIEGDKDLVNVLYRQPVIRDFEDEVALSLGFTYQDGQTFIFENIGSPFGIGPDEDGVSRTSVISFGPDYLHRGSNFSSFIGAQINIGTGVLNATTNSGAIPDGEFVSWTGLGQVAWRWNDRLLSVLEGRLQLTDDPLLGSEQFILGGMYSVRGYRLNARNGDNGFRLSKELRVTLLRDRPYFRTVQLIPFVDLGKTWNVPENPNPQERQRFLIGAGVGLFWEPAQGIDVRLDYGFPFIDLDDRGNDVQDNGFFFSVNVQPYEFYRKYLSSPVPQSMNGT